MIDRSSRYSVRGAPSPDGKSVAALIARSRGLELRRIAADGTSAISAYGPAAMSSPAWTPSGDIACVLTGGAGARLSAPSRHPGTTLEPDVAIVGPIEVSRVVPEVFFASPNGSWHVDLWRGDLTTRTAAHPNSFTFDLTDKTPACVVARWQASLHGLELRRAVRAAGALGRPRSRLNQSTPCRFGFCFFPAMTVGEELVAARERLGLSRADIAARTKIKIERLAAIEEMDADQLPFELYLKSFLRAYAIEVQLDPDDILRRYLASVGTATRAPAFAARAQQFFREVTSSELNAEPAPRVSRRFAHRGLRLVPFVIGVVLAVIAGVFVSAALDGFRKPRIPSAYVEVPTNSTDVSRANASATDQPAPAETAVAAVPDPQSAAATAPPQPSVRRAHAPRQVTARERRVAVPPKKAKSGEDHDTNGFGRTMGHAFKSIWHGLKHVVKPTHSAEPRPAATQRRGAPGSRTPATQ